MTEANREPSSGSAAPVRISAITSAHPPYRVSQDEAARAIVEYVGAP